MRWMIAPVLLIFAAVGCREGSGSPTSTVPPAATGASAEASPSAAASSAPVATPVPGVAAVDYSDQDSWLCLPDKPGDLCTEARTAVVLTPSQERYELNVVAPQSTGVDCFYVYPTVSTDLTVNSDLEPNAAERSVIVAQAAPFVSACRVFAPVYRQLTLTALTTGRFSDGQGIATAYGDVVAAWQHYLANENDGRPVVLIGHSQGAMVLRRLIMEHVDPNPEVREKLAAAFLLGTTVNVPAGQDVGGDFKNIPACRSAEQEGCVLSYATFNESSPPPITSLFGRGAGTNEALCVNPSELTGGALTTWVPVGGTGVTARSGLAANVTTDQDYVVYEDLVEGNCARTSGLSYLSVALNDGGKAWGVGLPAFITGPAWGLHNLDVSVAVGNLVELVAGYGE